MIERLKPFDRLARLVRCGGALSLMIVLFAAMPAAAARAETAEDFVQTLGDRAIDILKTKETSTFEEREQEFRTLLVQGFDMATISRFVLGRHAQAMTPEQLADYERLFIDFIVRVYAVRFDGYSGQTFEVKKVLDKVESDVIVRANIELGGDNPPVRTDWRVRDFGQSLKIIDVYVEGISMLNSQRQEFGAVIERKGLEGLLDDLRARLAQPVSAAGASETQTAVQ